jgi:hypothetical protein
MNPPEADGPWHIRHFCASMGPMTTSQVGADSAGGWVAGTGVAVGTGVFVGVSVGDGVGVCGT